MLRRYLCALLGRAEGIKLMDALADGKTVIVKGRQQTGKTTLVNVLNKSGYHAVEDFDTVEIELKEPLNRMIPDFSKTISVGQGTSGKY